MSLSHDIWTKKSQDEIFLEKLVHINSQTANIKGNQKVLKMIEESLYELGFNVDYLKSDAEDGRSLLVANKKTTRSNPLSVCFIGHSDVVTSPITVPFFETEDKISGAGVADNKGGVTLMLSALKSFLNKTIDQNFNIKVVISPSEETGSLGFHHHFNEIGKESDYVIGLEPALSCGSLIEARSGNRWYNIESRGIASHSGRFGQSYINAAHQLSLVIAGLHDLNSEIEKRRVNIGGFQTSLNTFNTICSSASAKLDTRFSTFNCRLSIHEEIEKILSQSVLTCPYTNKRGNLYYSIEDDCPPMQATSKLWLKSYRKRVSALESKELELTHSGGAADINYFANSDSLLIDGMGPVAGGLHTKNEYIERKTLKTRKEALVELLMSLNENNNRRVLWN